MRVRQLSLVISALALLLVCVPPVMARDTGNLIVRVSPKEAYIYADGIPVTESKGHFVTLSPGEHKIDLFNYGFRSETRNVTITAHKTLWIDVAMQAIPGMVTGPWGCITIKGPSRAAVLLNGKNPEGFFVGHVDEFDNEFIWKQELIVPPGHHELTVEYDHGDPWTTGVDVEANHRVVVDAYKGVRKTVAWSRGEQLKELPQFHAGIASAAVVVQKVTGLFSSSTGQVNCGEPAHLTWSSTGATKVELNGIPVSASGDQTVQPNQNTHYKFTAAGPGGVYTSDAAVNVNNAVTASLNVSPDDVRYDQAGEKIGTGTPTVTWSAANASSVSIDPLGSVGTSGSQPLQVTPPSGPGIQTVTYTLHATNACGGSVTRTASLQVTGPNQVLQGAVNNEPAPTVESTPVESAPVETAALDLPKTASTLPLVGLVGVLSLCAAGILLVISKHVA